MSADARHDILERRAAELARPIAASRADAVLDLLLVATGDRLFALEARAVRQVLQEEPLCRLSGGSGAFVAVAIVGGETIPVADLGPLVDGGEVHRDRSFLVVLEGGTGPVGFLVDQVLDVVAMHQDDLGVVSGTADGPGAPHRLITPDGAIVLETEPLLGDSRLAVTPSSARPPSHSPSQPPRGAR